MALKRFIVELGTGADLHGENVTEAACRAVQDAIGRSCLCGLVEILGMAQLDAVHVDILVATPRPRGSGSGTGEKDGAHREGHAFGPKRGGMTVQGLCVDRFGPECDQIVVANAAVTVSVEQ